MIMRKHISRNIRNEVIDRQRGMCRRCDKRLEQSDTHIDHIIPVEDRGESDISNYQALCGSCHNKKTHEDRLRKQHKKKKENDSREEDKGYEKEDGLLDVRDDPLGLSNKDFQIDKKDFEISLE